MWWAWLVVIGLRIVSCGLGRINLTHLIRRMTLSCTKQPTNVLKLSSDPFVCLINWTKIGAAQFINEATKI
ncbi:hypothetical protein HYC85_025603 [Camellia sinensis]|uniref:Uncharacterized protein n=1 Tax=Camellia sinensis TaxID=4442 RepID=A0A7J7GC03_CAMSI|nr:hypothetical protein HYC85_025603 [Camellia sinensis]